MPLKHTPLLFFLPSFFSRSVLFGTAQAGSARPVHGGRRGDGGGVNEGSAVLFGIVALMWHDSDTWHTPRPASIVLGAVYLLFSLATRLHFTPQRSRIPHGRWRSAERRGLDSESARFHLR